MALYQPSNITPSTFAGTEGSAVSASDNVSISWQINGNSGMSGFKIEVFANNTSSTLVHTFTETLDNPFYGTDAEGNPQFYVYEPGVTWYSAYIRDGYSYKLKITQYWEEGNETLSVVQSSDSVFHALAAPSLSISPLGTITSVSQTFTGVLSGTNPPAVSWVRWVLENEDGDVIDDTGTLYTGVLSYTYDRFFTGQYYTLSCTVGYNGLTKTVQQTYPVSYTMPEQTGGLTITCNPDNSVSMKWGESLNIPGTPSAQDYGVVGGFIHLLADRSIVWNTVNGSSMSFAAPYCFAWNGAITSETTETQTVNSGTWELWKTYPETRTKTSSISFGPGDWQQNPGTPTTATREKTVSITVSTPVYSEGQKASTPTPLNSIGSYEAGGVTYTYKNASPSVLSSDTDIDGIVGMATAYYEALPNSYSPLSEYSIGIDDSDPRSYKFTVFSNDSEAYGKNIRIFATVKTKTYGGSASQAPTSGDTGITNPVITSKSSALTSATIAWSGSYFTFTGASLTSGTYSITYQYTYTVASSNKYKATGTIPLNESGGTLTGATVLSTTASSATAQVGQNNNATVTAYNGSNSASVTVSVRLTYTVRVTGSNSYRTTVTGTKAGAISASVSSTTATSATVTLNASTGAYTVTMYYSSSSSRTATIAFNTRTYAAKSGLAILSDGTNTLTLSVATSPARMIFAVGGNTKSVSIPDGAEAALAVIRPASVYFVFFGSNLAVLSKVTATHSLTLPSPISSVTIQGEQTCSYLYITANASYDFDANNYTPGWDVNTKFYAAFENDLQAGTGTSGSSLVKTAIYRGEGDELVPVGVFNSGVHSIRDYGIRSGHTYYYELFYISSGVYSAGAQSDEICVGFRQHTLIEAEEDANQRDVFHPVHVWRFSDNLDAGSYTNQNAPVLLQNFTKYPLWQPSSQAAKTGTLTALLGRFAEGTYTGGTTADMDALFALSESVNPLFYRDMKGNLYMVRLAGPITQTVNNKSGILEVSVSVPWVEVGDASDAKIYTEG